MITGGLETKCKECNCRFSWYIDTPLPFIDSEIIGTCDQCLTKKTHNCFDEYMINQDGQPIKVGKKEFHKKEKNKKIWNKQTSSNNQKKYP